MPDETPKTCATCVHMLPRANQGKRHQWRRCVKLNLDTKPNMLRCNGQHQPIEN